MHWLFVYGTLMPGRLRWPLVAGDVVDRRPASVPGTLYDTGQGYPALVPAPAAASAAPSAAPAAAGSAAGAGAGGVGGGAGGGEVHGWLLGVPDDAAAGFMDRLDEVEGPNYVRVPVRTADGTDAVAYGWFGAVPDGFTALAGRWESEDER